MSQPRSRLRAALAESKMVLAPFAYDALHAKIAEAAGFEAVYMTGFGTAAARGFPDLGLITLAEMVQNVRSVARSVKIPVVCDATMMIIRQMFLNRTKMRRTFSNLLLRIY